MKKLAIILAATALLLTGCYAKEADTTIPKDIPEQTQGAGQAVVPEEGDIMIEIG